VQLLLDTSIVIAVVNERMSLLGASMREAIIDSRSALHASVATLWEIAIKVRLGKLEIRLALDLLPETLQQTGVQLIRIDYHHVLAAVDPEPATRDPFDRLLLAQCQIENLRLVTVDRALKAHPLAWRPA
jgi:PIN domain nuclease of toxin-antitoxin system